MARLPLLLRYRLRLNLNLRLEQKQMHRKTGPPHTGNLTTPGILLGHQGWSWLAAGIVFFPVIGKKAACGKDSGRRWVQQDEKDIGELLL
jgi:hypothetical protein